MTFQIAPNRIWMCFRRNVKLEALLVDDLLDLTRIAHGKLELRNDAIDVHAWLNYALGISASDLNGRQVRIYSKIARPRYIIAGPMPPGCSRFPGTSLRMRSKYLPPAASSASARATTPSTTSLSISPIPGWGLIANYSRAFSTP